MLSYILQKLYSILGWKENIPIGIGLDKKINEKMKIYQPLQRFIFNNKCTQNIGCRYHRDWDFCRVKTIFYNPPDFSNIQLQNNFRTKNDIKNSQYLCYLANYR